MKKYSIEDMLLYGIIASIITSTVYYGSKIIIEEL